jgi:hypothetical protein
MASSSAALIFHDDGSIEATPELKDALHFAGGTRLELVSQSEGEVHFRVPVWPVEIRDWRDLQGILANSPIDPNAELDIEKQRELESESR